MCKKISMWFLLPLSHICCCSANDKTHELLKFNVIENHLSLHNPSTFHFSHLSSEAASFLKNSRGINIHLQCILCLIYGGWSLVVYINVTEDQLLSIFCLSEALKDFYSISKKLYMLLNTEDKRFYYLKKILWIKDVKNTQTHTVPSGLQQQLLCFPLLSPGKRLEAGMLMWVFCATVWSLDVPLGEKYLAVLEPWDQEWLRQGKRKMLWLCTSKVSSTVLKDRRGSVCHLPSWRFNQDSLSLSSTNSCSFSHVHLIRNPGLVSI